MIMIVCLSTFHQCKVLWLQQCMVIHCYLNVTGYESTILYAEAATRFFQANDSDENYLIIEEVKIFFNANNGTRNYFTLEEDTQTVKLTHDSNNASFFTLLTTPNLHTEGQFQIAYKDSTTLDISKLVMTFDFSSPHFSQDGPYKLVTEDYSTSFYDLEIRGKNTDVPPVKHNL